MLSIKTIREAAERLNPVLPQTPLLENATLNEQVGGRVLIKAENLQRTGTFKIRGALNVLLGLTKPEIAQGVVAYSSGNHAQAVAYAARFIGAKATIIMPADAPLLKIEKTKAYGAEVILYDRYTESREDIGQKLTKEKGAILVKPYDDFSIMSGQGTAGLEIAQVLQERQITPDQYLVCCGGGGLAAGTITALKHTFPALHAYTVEPSGFDDTARSLEAGKRLSNPADARSICDALLAPTPGDLTFPVLQELGTNGFSVTEADVGKAMRFAFSELKLVLEPGGAVALAALLAGKIATKGKTSIILCSGGNVDPALFSQIIQAAD